MPEIDDVVAGEPVESSWGNLIRSRTVQRYVDATERDVLNPTPQDGDLAFLQGVNELQAFGGSTWSTFLEETDGPFLPLAGGTMQGVLEMDTHNIEMGDEVNGLPEMFILTETNLRGGQMNFHARDADDTGMVEAFEMRGVAVDEYSLTIRNLWRTDGGDEVDALEVGPNWRLFAPDGSVELKTEVAVWNPAGTLPASVTGPKTAGGAGATPFTPYDLLAITPVTYLLEPDEITERESDPGELLGSITEDVADVASWLLTPSGHGLDKHRFQMAVIEILRDLNDRITALE